MLSLRFKLSVLWVMVWKRENFEILYLELFWLWNFLTKLAVSPSSQMGLLLIWNKKCTLSSLQMLCRQSIQKRAGRLKYKDGLIHILPPHTYIVPQKWHRIGLDPFSHSIIFYLISYHLSVPTHHFRASEAVKVLPKKRSQHQCFSLSPFKYFITSYGLPEESQITGIWIPAGFKGPYLGSVKEESKIY